MEYKREKVLDHYCKFVSLCNQLTELDTRKEQLEFRKSDEYQQSGEDCLKSVMNDFSVEATPENLASIKSIMNGSSVVDYTSCTDEEFVVQVMHNLVTLSGVNMTLFPTWQDFSNKYSLLIVSA